MTESELRTIVENWATQEHRIRLVYLFGSRATGRAIADSDIDLALIVSDEPDYPALAFAIIEKDRLRQSLAPLLPYRLDLQFAFSDDAVVMPAVTDHGLLLYEAPDRDFSNNR